MAVRSLPGQLVNYKTRCSAITHNIAFQQQITKPHLVLAQHVQNIKEIKCKILVINVYCNMLCQISKNMRHTVVV